MKAPSTMNQGRTPSITGLGTKLSPLLAAPKLEIQSITNMHLNADDDDTVGSWNLWHR